MSVPGAETSCQLEFGPGTYRFFLPLKGIVEVERLCEKAIGSIYDDLSGAIGIEKETDKPVYIIGGPARAKDAYQVIRIAAQYGGEAEIAGEAEKVSALDATRLVDAYVDGRPFSEFMPVAWAILRATLMGISLKKKAPAAVEDTNLSSEVKS